MQITTIRELAYALYRVEWERRVSTQRKLDSLKNYYKEIDADTREEYEYSDYLSEFGYDGELYACYDEFMDTEYLDEDFMRQLLDNDALFEEYKQDLTNPQEEEDTYD